jgi:hypothetical protein
MAEKFGKLGVIVPAGWLHKDFRNDQAARHSQFEFAYINAYIVSFCWSPYLRILRYLKGYFQAPGLPPAAGSAGPSWPPPGTGRAHRGAAESEDPPAGRTRPPSGAGEDDVDDAGNWGLMEVQSTKSGMNRFKRTHDGFEWHTYVSRPSLGIFGI